MKKLEDIPKKNVFQVPEGYFERLPGIIQSRVILPSPATRISWVLSVGYAVPIILLMTIGIFWYRTTTSNLLSTSEIESQLQAIQPDQLATYLEDRELSTDELVETVTWSPDDLQELENTVYSAMDVSNKELEKMIDEYDDL